mmetsp:Transcript_16289/g.41648  ORF Transcript_16289/g.41648 Transcript_16289/m.41648 type:complete len:238 (+) Transcript_16289:470-1183(+)
MWPPKRNERKLCTARYLLKAALSSTSPFISPSPSNKPVTSAMYFFWTWRCSNARLSATAAGIVLAHTSSPPVSLSSRCTGCGLGSASGAWLGCRLPPSTCLTVRRPRPCTIIPGSLCTTAMHSSSYATASRTLRRAELRVACRCSSRTEVLPASTLSSHLPRRHSPESNALIYTCLRRQTLRADVIVGKRSGKVAASASGRGPPTENAHSNSMLSLPSPWVSPAEITPAEKAVTLRW